MGCRAIVDDYDDNIRDYTVQSLCKCVSCYVILNLCYINETIHLEDNSK
jgi:hypothetical protein